MTDERCKQLMEQVGYPNSISLKEALFQVANETEQEVRASLSAPVTPVAVEVRTAFITVPMWRLDHYTFDYPSVKDGKIHTWQIRDCGDWRRLKIAKGVR